MKVILGAGCTVQEGWTSMERDKLDITSSASFYSALGPDPQVEAFLAEHVWEHLTAEEALLAARNCHSFLIPGGRLRLAVPDGLHPDPAYIEWVKPGGTGYCAGEHKMLFDHWSMAVLLEEAGFRKITLLEWWNDGVFRFLPWSSRDGHIRRSIRYDPRNSSAEIPFTSLIVDAVKT